MLINQSTIDRWKQEAEAYKPNRAPLRMRKRPRLNSRKKRRGRYWKALEREEEEELRRREESELAELWRW